VRLHCLPNFSERHLIELQKVLVQNEAFRSNQTQEPCQCPIILDVCSKQSPNADSVAKLFKTFKRLSDLYTECMLHTGPGASGGVNGRQKISFHELQSRVTQLTREEPRLYRKHYQVPFETCLKHLQKVQAELAELNVLKPFSALLSGPSGVAAAATSGAALSAKRDQLANMRASKNTRLFDDTLGSGVALFIQGCSSLCHGGYDYYEDYDVSLGVLDLLKRVREMEK